MKTIFVMIMLFTMALTPPEAERGLTAWERIPPEAAAFYELQESVDNGHQPWRINPEEVALEFAERTLGFKGETLWEGGDEEKESTRVIFTKQDGGEIHIDLYQPARKGPGGIWEVDYWFDENHKEHQVRDLAALPPLFYNDENVPLSVREAVRDMVVKDFSETFGKYYNVLGFYAGRVLYTQGEGKAELYFGMTLVTQNFYKDPDTVEYIRQAKESGSKYYQTYYDEYNMPKTGNIDLKATMLIDASGGALPESIELFSNISIDSEPEYVPVKASDFIMSE